MKLLHWIADFAEEMRIARTFMHNFDRTDRQLARRGTDRAHLVSDYIAH